MRPKTGLDAVDKIIFVALAGNQTPVVQPVAKRYSMKTPVTSNSVFFSRKHKATWASFPETKSARLQIFVSGYLRNT
jgi:hypothetical protein